MAVRSGWIFLCLGLGCLACTASVAERQWQADLTEADRLADEARYQEAILAYQALLERTDSLSDQRHLSYRIGRMKERLGDWEAALSLYVGLADDRSVIADEDDHTAQAMFRLGAILYDQLQREEEALAIWKLVVAYYPDCDGPARRALDGLVVHWEQNGLHVEAVRYFEESYRSLAATRMGDNLLYWLGYWYRQHLGDEGRAYSVFRQLRDHYYDTSSLRDDAEWQMVEILHGWGEFKRELDLLRAIADERDANFIFGSNATSSMENAAFRIGVVVQEDLGDRRGAIDEFQQFLDGWRFSLLRDDAAYRIFQLTLELGDVEETARLAGRFLLDYPESRHCEEVQQMVGELEERRP